MQRMPITVAARCKAWVCGRSLAGILGSRAAGDMDVCLLWVLSGTGLCVWLITRSEESYCVCVVGLSDRESLTMKKSWPTRGFGGTDGEGEKKFEEWITAVTLYRDHPTTCLCRNRGEEEVYRNPFRISLPEAGEWSMRSFGRSCPRENPISTLGGPRGWSGRARKISHTGIRSLDRPGRSSSL